MRTGFCAGLALCFLFFIGLSPALIHAKHGQVPKWVDKNTDAKGNPCCGNKDCIPVSSVEVLHAGAGYVDIIIDGEFGVVFEHTVRILSCQKDDSRSFICLYPQFFSGGKRWEDCTIGNPDGTHRLVINPSCVRCVLVPRCTQDYL